MKSSALLLLLVSWLGVAHGAPIVVSDDDGRTVRLDAPARRIVSLSPALTELLFEVGAGARVVAVDSASDFPPPVKRLPKVGSLAGLDLERIVALQPDLVLVWHHAVAPRTLNWLRDLGVPVHVTGPRNLAQIGSTLERLGQLTGQERQARAAADKFRREVRRLRQAHQRPHPLRVFYQVWRDPLITINGGQFISEVIALCGGENVFADLPQGSPRVSVEAVLAHDPQVIVAGGTPGHDDLLDAWRRWPTLSAVRNQRLLLLPADLLQRPSARLLQGAEILCQRMQEFHSEGTPHSETEVSFR